MIAMLLFAATPAVIETPDPSARRVSIQAVVMLPKLTEFEKGMLDVLVKTIPKRTAEYSKTEMLIATDGATVTCDRMPDSVRIGVSVLPDNFRAGMGVVNNLLHKATLSDADLIAANSEPEMVSRWMSPRWTADYPMDRFRTDRARALYGQVFQPENITISVGGAFENGAAAAIWKRDVASWGGPRIHPFQDDFSVSKPRVMEGGNPKIEHVDHAFDPSAKNILAMFALGSGKGSSLFRIVRDQMAVSYRQEAIIWPTDAGFQSCLQWATSGDTKLADVQAALTKDIDAWTDAERLRAIGMASGVFDLGVDASPFYFTPTGPIGHDLDDRTFMKAYWYAKTGQDWDPAKLIKDMRSVSLDDLKAAAKTIVG
ncbi:hypothetical protein BH11ARM1_BH11ARM1_11450 [soil metagenome]